VKDDCCEDVKKLQPQPLTTWNSTSLCTSKKNWKTIAIAYLWEENIPMQVKVT